VEEAWETWLTAPAEQALALQKPAPNDALRIIAIGKREDAEGEWVLRVKEGSSRSE
jgi:putative SOS response-associated peptidase YedK